MYAIIGIGCRLPGGVNSPAEFYKALKNRRDCVGKIPPERWNEKYFQSNQIRPGTMVNHKCGMVDPFFTFDNDCFQFSKKEALSLDPSIKFFLEVALQTFEDANVKYKGTKTGVFIGSGQMGFTKYCTRIPEYNTEYAATGTSLAIHANMITYKFDLRGPSCVTESACSSSGSAMYVATKALESGDIDMALVGGFNSLLNHSMTIAFSRLGVLAPDGKCKSFDSRANGYVRSEGCGLVLLKPLKKALKDRNHIYCVVRGAYANSDGALEPSLTKPSKLAQFQLMKEAFKKAKVDPSELFYFEAHATGTQVGDPVEMNTIGKICKRKLDKQPLKLGSVKTNIGHTEIASFAASCIKTCIMIDKKELLPTIHLKSVNPKLKMKKYNMKVQTEVEKFDPHGKIFAVNSFGFGGANACAVLQGLCPPQKKVSETLKPPYVYIISARTRDALKERVQQFQEYSRTGGLISEEEGLEIVVKSEEEEKMFQLELSYTLNTFVREQDRYLTFGIGESCHTSKFVLPGFSIPEHPPALCFVFSGQGPQHLLMGRELFKKFPVFKNCVLECDQIYKGLTGFSVVEDIGLFGEKVAKQEEVNRIMVTLAGLMFTQLGLWELVKSFGISPTVIIGHSFGEMCAMYANGAVTLEQIVNVTVKRAELCHDLENLGKMIAVGCSVEDIQSIIKENNIPSLWISAENSPVSCTVGGLPESIFKLDKLCEENKIFHRILSITNAYHTPLLHPLRKKADSAFGSGCLADLGSPKLSFVSTVTGNFWEKGEQFTNKYFFDNILQTVNFRSGIETILREYGEETVFLELAPHPVLGLSMKQCGAKNVISTLQKGKSEQTTILSALSKLVQFGYPTNWDNVLGKGLTRMSYLPTYPFQRRECFFKIDVLENELVVPEFFHDPEKIFAGALIGRKEDSSLDVWKGLINTHKFPWLKDHVVHDAIIFPGAGYVEICLEYMMTKYYLDNEKTTTTATTTTLEEGKGKKNDEEIEGEGEGEEEKEKKKKNLKLVVRNVDILNPLSIPTEQIIFTTVETKVSERGKLSISSRKQDSIGNWVPHMNCLIENIKEIKSSPVMKIPKLEGTKMSKKEIYSRFEVLQNLRYGEKFRLIETIIQGDEEVLAEINVKNLLSIDHINEWYVLHPALLDNIIQCFLVTYKEMKTYLPTSIKRFELYGERIIPKDFSKILVHAYLKDRSDKRLVGNCVAFDETGKILLKVEEFEFSAVSSNASAVKEKEQFYTMWQSRKLPDFGEKSFSSVLEKPWKEVEKNFLPKLKSWVLKKIQPGIRRLKSLGIPKDKHFFMNWISEMEVEAEKVTDDDLLFEEYDGPFDLEMKLVMNIVQHLPSLMRKKSGKLTEGKKRNELIDALFSQKSLSFRSTIKILISFFQKIVNLCEDRVLRILEIGEMKYFSFLDHLVPLMESLNGRIEVIVTSKLPKQDFSFVHFKKIDVSKDLSEQGLFPCSIDIIISNGIPKLLPSLHNLLVENGLLLLTEFRSEYSKFLNNFIFGPLLENFSPSSVNQEKFSLSKWAEENGYNVSNLISTNSCDILFGRKKDEKDEKEEASEEVLIFDDSSTLKLLDFVQYKIQKKDFRNFLILTRGVYDETLPILEYSGNIGFTRSLQSEHLSWNIKLVDLPSSLEKSEEQKIISMLLSRFLELENESYYSVSEGLRVPRIVKFHNVSKTEIVEDQEKKEKEENEEEEEKKKKNIVPSRSYRLYVDQPGLLNSLQFHALENPSIPLKPNEVYCKVVCGSLNFKDVMLAMNMLKSFKPELGLEFSGIVLHVGKNVENVKIGDEVYGFANHSLSSHVLTSCFLIDKKPEKLTHEQACAIPTILLTTYIALIKKCNIQKNQRILLHSAAGGIGQASIEWIRTRGAIPIATCGSEKKREFLKKLGVKIFGNSHRDDWDREILSQLPQNEKIDVVLNSLAKDHIMRGIRILKPFGAFVEIGKRDILDNSHLYLSPFLENLSYFSVHIDRMIDQKPSMIQPLFQEISGYLASGKINPIRVDKVYPVTKVVEAFRYMQSGGHMGKIVIKFCDDPNKKELSSGFIPNVLSKKTLFTSKKIYILSGGLGVIGFELARWMVELGARNIILISRSGKQTKSQKRQLKKLGEANSRVKIRVSKTDVSDSSSVKKLYENLFTNNSFEFPTAEIGGIIHLAMVLRDGMIANQTRKRFEESFGPKIEGAKNLVNCGEEIMKDKFSPAFIIFFSSISATIGNPEQSNYAAGNSFLDRYAYYLNKVKNYHAKAINLGAVLDVGVIAENLTLRKIMEQGVLWGSAMTLNQVLASVGKMVEDASKEKKAKDGKEQIQYIPEIEVEKLVETYPRLIPKFGHLRKSVKISVDGKIGKMKEATATNIQGIVGGLLMMDPKRVPVNEALTRYGVDSLLAVEISSILKSKYDVLVSQMEILAGMTIDQIMKLVDKE